MNFQKKEKQKGQEKTTRKKNMVRLRRYRSFMKKKTKQTSEEQLQRSNETSRHLVIMLTVSSRCNIYDTKKYFLFKTVDCWLPTSLFVEWKKAMESYRFFNSIFIVFTGNSTLCTTNPPP